MNQVNEEDSRSITSFSNMTSSDGEVANGVDNSIDDNDSDNEIPGNEIDG